ncbi:protein unc-93 homolog A-like [Elysia marginata]|uniref:Protein unc-93 homolog A-like n=1 Tax=Elysia marginata TaxID=1093978 RepID=A0AAV4GFH7_9GAST|nr:protein unc-93 homolog A-like [Elysia marginata]
MAAIIISLLLDPITLDNENKSGQDRKLSPKLLVATFKHLLSSPVQVLLIPITLYSGIEQALLQGDFTKSYITCTLGIWNLGYVMICYGVVDAICSLLFGRLVQYIGHIPFFVLAFITHGALQVVFLLWTPTKGQEVLFYVFAGLWGMGDAVIQTQVNALYGNIFSNKAEAAFANYRLWESVGFMVTYAYNDYLCTYTKLYIAMASLGLSVVCYFAVEIVTWRTKRNTASQMDGST